MTESDEGPSHARIAGLATCKDWHCSNEFLVLGLGEKHETKMSCLYLSHAMVVSLAASCLICSHTRCMPWQDNHERLW